MHNILSILYLSILLTSYIVMLLGSCDVIFQKNLIVMHPTKTPYGLECNYVLECNYLFLD